MSAVHCMSIEINVRCVCYCILLNMLRADGTFPIIHCIHVDRNDSEFDTQEKSCCLWNQPATNFARCEMIDRWEEGPSKEGAKWRKLTHRGPVFPKPYKRLPPHIYYDGHTVSLNKAAKEVAGFYAQLLDHDYTRNIQQGNGRRGEEGG